MHTSCCGLLSRSRWRKCCILIQPRRWAEACLYRRPGHRILSRCSDGDWDRCVETGIHHRASRVDGFLVCHPGWRASVGELGGERVKRPDRSPFTKQEVPTAMNARSLIRRTSRRAKITSSMPRRPSGRAARDHAGDGLLGWHPIRHSVRGGGEGGATPGWGCRSLDGHDLASSMR